MPARTVSLSAGLSKRETEQILNQIMFLAGRQSEMEACVVVVDDGSESGEATIVEEAALRVRKDRADRRRAIPPVRRSIRLKRVDADLGRRVQVPARFGPDWFDMTVVAAGFAAEQLIAPLGRCRIEAAGARLRRRNRELIELQIRKLRTT